VRADRANSDQDLFRFEITFRLVIRDNLTSDPFEQGNNRGRWFGFATLALMLAALFMIFDYVPTEIDEGIVQRIFYFHVPCAWVAFMSFGLVAIAGVLYLWLGDQIWDDLGYAAAETGMVFCTLVLVTGSIWARPIWGVWWTGDSRLTTTFILWLMYGGYLLLRASADETPQVARFAAVVGIVAALDVPIVIVSVRLWRTIHPAVLVMKQGGHGLQDPRMIATLLVSLVAMTALWAWLLILRFAQLRARSHINELTIQLGFADASIGH
jgi:heme exporter protein C